MRLFPSPFIALTAVAQMILMAVTWPLWFSKTEYPQVALISLADGLPLWLHQSLSAVLLAGCFLLAALQWKACGRRSSESTTAGGFWIPIWLPRLILFCSSTLVLLDQHRLQPWHWLTILLLAEWMVLRQNDFLKTARVTFATIYIFAALSRFGPDVASGISGQVLKVILQTIDLEWIKPSDGRFFLLATVMNLVELLIGVALLFRRTRKVAVVAAVLLHLTLILCLSPLGLNHHVAVLVWNAFLMIAVPILFWRDAFEQTIVGVNAAASPSSVTVSSAAVSSASAVAGLPSSATSVAQKDSAIAKLLWVVVLAIPFGGLMGFSDNWLGWQVYSPRPEVLKLTVNESSVQFLPASLKPFVQPPEPLQSDCPIRLDLWSLHCKQVPMYPEDRFQFATAKFVVAQAVENGATKKAFQAHIQAPMRFLWWKRTTIEVSL